MSSGKQLMVGISGHDVNGNVHHFVCPRVEGKVVNGQIAVQCPYCSEAHWHGGEIGHRASHCWDRRVREISAPGYLLLVRGGRPAGENRFPAIEADVVEGQAIIRCPYCAKKHCHGASAGYRIPPCSGAGERRGYVIHIEGDHARRNRQGDRKSRGDGEHFIKKGTEG